MSTTLDTIVPPPLPAATAATAELRAGAPLPAGIFEEVRRTMLLDCCKWDPQVGDVAALAPFPLLLSAAAWAFLRDAAERLAAETLAIEHELLRRPDLHGTLALPRRLRRLFAAVVDREIAITPAAARVMRFDFHPTADGWRVSEVNSDVPGGFTEASAFTAAVARHVPGAVAAGDPAGELARSLAAAADAGDVALLCAAGFMEDQQVVANLARLLRRLGVTCHLAQPGHLRWRDGCAHLDAAWNCGRLGAIVRFYQAEWLANLRGGARAAWQPMFVGGETRVCNPGVAALSESKRLPLVWDDLSTPVPAWRRFLPETRALRDANWRRGSDWLIKTAFCNTGDAVAAADLVPPKQWRRVRLDALLHPGQWIAQRRFDITPLDTPAGRMFPCVGVYTINGRACGIYGRLSPTPVISYSSTDVAVLVEQTGGGEES